MLCFLDYELVRIHHPDSPRCRSLPSNVCRSRFQAITAAYDVLTGKVQRPTFSAPSHSSADQWHRQRASYAHRHRSHSFHAEWAQQADAAEENADDRWKDRVIMAVGVFVSRHSWIEGCLRIKLLSIDHCCCYLPIPILIHRLVTIRTTTHERSKELSAST